MRCLSVALAAAALIVTVAVHPVRADEALDAQVKTHLQKATAAAQEKNWDGALAELDAAIALDKTSVAAHSGRAVMLSLKKDYKGAIAAADTVIALDAKNAGAYKMRSGFYRQSGEPEKAQADYLTFLKLSPADAAEMQALAQAATDGKKYERAANLWSVMAEVHPDDAKVHYARGLALRAFATSLATPENEGNEEMQGAIARMREDARGSFTAAIKADPRFVPGYLALSDRTSLSGFNPGIIEGGLKIMPDNVELLVAHGEVLTRFYTQGDKLQKALASYSRAIELDPKNTAAYSGRARAYVMGDEQDKALADATRALELDPNNLEALRTRARVYLFKRDYEKQAADMERALPLAPGNWDVAFEHYLAMNNLTDKTRAFAAINKLVEGRPDFLLYRLLRAKLYLEKKDTKNALADVDKILELDPEYKDAQELRAKIVAP